jgi:hypothetical protein
LGRFLISAEYKFAQKAILTLLPKLADLARTHGPQGDAEMCQNIKTSAKLAMKNN